MASGSGTLRLVVQRSDPGATREFVVPRDGLCMVLDLLTEASRQDPSLYFRYSCRSGFCGTCTVLMDGRPVLACQTSVGEGGDVVHLAPLGGYPVVRDLVVDPAPFADRWQRVEPRLDPVATGPSDDEQATGPRPLDPAGRSVIEASLDCISCGACFAACDLSALDRVFLGPAALTRAMVLLADDRDSRHDEHLAIVAGSDGVEGCHGIGACSLACPKGLDPARAIRRIRRSRMSARS